MRKLKIIGIGSPLGADQLGMQVIENLREHSIYTAHREKFELVSLDRPGISLIDYFTDSGEVWLVDAVSAGGARGSVLKIDALKLMGGEGVLTANQMSSHDIGLAETILLAKTLNCLPEKLTLYGIEIEADVGCQLPKPALARLMNKILQDLNQWIGRNYCVGNDCAEIV